MRSDNKLYFVTAPASGTFGGFIECGKQIIFSSYDPKLDKSVFTEPIWGLKKSIEIAPDAVSVKDFDFKRQKNFHLLGFQKPQRYLDIPRYLEQTKVER